MDESSSEHPMVRSTEQINIGAAHRMVLTFLSRSIFPNIVFIPGLFYLKVVGFPIFSQDGQTKCLFAEVVEARPLSL